MNSKIPNFTIKLSVGNSRVAKSRNNKGNISNEIHDYCQLDITFRKRHIEGKSFKDKKNNRQVIFN